MLASSIASVKVSTALIVSAHQIESGKILDDFLEELLALIPNCHTHVRR
jgi:hypothetical protein